MDSEDLNHLSVISQRNKDLAFFVPTANLPRSHSPSQVATMVKTRKVNFSKKDYDLAKRLLRQYDEAVQPCGKVDKTRQSLQMTKAYSAFLAETESKNTTRDSFRKLLSRIR